MLEHFNFVRHTAKIHRLIVPQKILVQTFEVAAKEIMHRRQEPAEIVVRNCDPEINVPRKAVITVMIHGVTAHEQVFNSGAIEARQKFAEFGR